MIYQQTDSGVLYCGDCLEILPTLEVKADLALTDPPYGIKMSKGFGGFRGFGGFGKPIASKQYDDDWDNQRPSKSVFDAILLCAVKSIIFGGNYFADILPQANHWAVWHKHNTMPTFSDCELLWTNIKRNSVKLFDYEYNGLLGKEKERFHPTQKPVNLIGMILNEYSKEQDLILDPFAGSGTTAIACIRYNRRYILIEKEEKYCEIAAKRIESELEQADIFRSEQ